MVQIYASGSRPVNGPDDSLVLNRGQLWQALQRKIRQPEEFVPILSGCKVTKDENGVVEREVLMDFGKWGKRPMAETVSSYGDLWIRFVQTEGSVSTNLVSYLPGVSDDKLILTYIFEWDFPSVKEGTPEHKELTQDMIHMAILAVNRSCERARELVTEGLVG